jgi:hypothetical protein
MRKAACVFISVASFALAACAHGPSDSESGGAPAASVAPMASVTPVDTAPVNTAPKGTLALGERITSPLVALADIAKNPAAYEGKTVATSGKVTAVCQEMGCWMQLEDATGQAHVRMHGHTFFVPKTAPGHLARVQATLVKPTGGATDCEEGKAAKLELVATGVEID